MKAKQDPERAPWNDFSGGGWICGIMALAVSLAPLYSATPVTGISDDNANADDVEAGLDRRKWLEGTFADRDASEWLQASRKRRDRWLDGIGLDIGATYDVAGLAAYGGSDSEYGFSGDFTVSGTWELFGKRWNRPLDLVFRFRNRHAISGLAASEVAGETGGLLWNLIDGFSDAGFEVPDFYLRQHLPSHDLEIRYGQMTIDSHFDRNALRSSKQAFFNRAFSSNPAVAFPRLGAGVTLLWKPEAYGFDLTLGATTVQGTQNGNQVDFNFESGDFFKAVQLGRDFQLCDRPARMQAMVWQGVVESFYRWQIGPSFQVTPEVQIVFGDGLNPSHFYRFVAGLRAELAF